MRQSTLYRGRQLGRLCEACKQRRALSISSRIPTTPSKAARNSSSSSAHSHGQNPALEQRRWLSIGSRLRSRTPPATVGAETPSPSEPEPRQTHYDFFPQTLPAGPPPSSPFTIDVRALRREFLQLQSKAHPDLHPAHLKSRAEAASARINEAFKTLSSPLLRAQYLLSLYGLDVANDETAKVEEPELLMEVLEAREEIEDALEESDLEAVRTRNQERERRSVEELERCFGEGDLDGAARECVRLRYWVNIGESLQNWERGSPIVLEH